MDDNNIEDTYISRLLKLNRHKPDWYKAKLLEMAKELASAEAFAIVLEHL